MLRVFSAVAPPARRFAATVFKSSLSWSGMLISMRVNPLCFCLSLYLETAFCCAEVTKITHISGYNRILALALTDIYFHCLDWASCRKATLIPKWCGKRKGPRLRASYSGLQEAALRLIGRKAAFLGELVNPGR